jgi:hypothetical protein
VPAVLALAVVLSLPSLAFAQGAEHIDEGVRLYEEADLNGALDALANAEEGPLDRSELLRLLLTRALVRFGLGEFGPLERDLLAIATIEPDYDLGVRAPPPLQNAFARAKERVTAPLGVRVELEGMAGGVRLEAVASGDRAGVVERVVIAARPAGQSEFSRGDGGTLTLPVGEGGEIELYAEAIGPGGAVLATDGTRQEPRRATVPAPVAAGGGGAVDTGPNVPLVVGVTVGSAVVVAAVIVAIVLATSGSGGTMPQGPIVER